MKTLGKGSPLGRKTFTGSYIERRGNTYFAVFYVPKDVQHIIGKKKFRKTTQTSDLKHAEQVASILVAGWKRDIDLARSSSPDPLIESALQLLKERKSNPLKHLVDDAIAEETDRVQFQKGDFIAEVFNNIATGTNNHLPALIPDWKKSLEHRGLKTKTIDQMVSDIEFLTKTFPTAVLLTEVNVQVWIEGLLKTLSTSKSTFKRTLSNFKSFFNYLKTIKEVPKTSRNPFEGIDYASSVTTNKGGVGLRKKYPWVPFTKDEVEDLHQNALAKGDEPLANLILIGAYTGLRIEEICSLKKADVNTDKRSITIVNAKTKAGERTIPIHSDIAVKVEALKQSSSDDFLLSGLTLNKYGDRSNAIGKRFGRLKFQLGHPETKVFHSIRKTFTTLLENAGITENVAADIVGHEKPRITYGLYSGGTQLDLMREAMEKIHYDF